jgi:hypothetical protein
MLAHTIGLGSLLIATVLGYGTARIAGLREDYRILEVAVGTSIIMGPLFLWKGTLTQTFSAHPITLMAYLAAMFTLVAVAIYTLEDFRKPVHINARIN